MRWVQEPQPERAATAAGPTMLLGIEPGSFRSSLRLWLEAQGCAVDLASGSDEVVEMASAGYDVIFLELASAGFDGLAAMRELNSANLAVRPPIVLLKGDDEPAHVVQRGLDLGAAGFIVKTRLPATLPLSTLLESFGVNPPGRRSTPQPVPRLRRLSSDACRFSSRGAFRDCPAFIAVNALVHADAGPERISCSHLRAGEADGWRLYPRCAIGDAAARAKYARDQTC